MAVAEPAVRALPSPRWRPTPPVASLRRLMARSRRADLVAASLFVVATAIALLGPLVAPHNPLAAGPYENVPPFHGSNLLGTDAIGRDVLSRVLYGIRTSWFSALAVIASGVVIGGAVGLAAGAAGGWVDGLLMRTTDAFLALPGPIIAICVVAALGPSLRNTLIAVGIVWWPFYARIVRGEITALSARPHLEAAKLAGVGPVRRALRHLLPGAVPAIVVTASLDVANLLVTLAGLSFLGLGSPEPAPELGAMAAQNLQYLLSDWWEPVMPALAIFLLAMAANLGGDGIRNLMRRS
jgi:peptide/nickel transport system permease protein